MDRDCRIFVLGYDLLRKRLMKSCANESDIAFNRCQEVCELFLQSGYNDDMNYSEYENLQRFVKENKFYWEA